MNTFEVQQRLRTHYLGANGSSEEWVLIPEARSGAGFDGNSSQCDLVALHTWQSRGLIVVGHEIKVSRGDWLKELKNPAKADWWWAMCHQWFLVVPKPYADIVKPGELPEGWGLIEVNDKARIVTKPFRPPGAAPKPVPWSVIVGWFAQLDRRQKSAATESLRTEYNKGVDHGRATEKLDWQSGRQMKIEDGVRERAAALKAETGIDLFEDHTWHLDRFAKLWKLADSFGGVSGLVSVIERTRGNAEQVLKMIDALTADAEPLMKAGK